MPYRHSPLRAAAAWLAVGLAALPGDGAADTPAPAAAGEVFGLTKVHTFLLTISAKDYEKMQPAGGMRGPGGFRRGPGGPPGAEAKAAKPADKPAAPDAASTAGTASGSSSRGCTRT